MPKEYLPSKERILQKLEARTVKKIEVLNESADYEIDAKPMEKRSPSILDIRDYLLMKHVRYGNEGFIF